MVHILNVISTVIRWYITKMTLPRTLAMLCIYLGSMLIMLSFAKQRRENNNLYRNRMINALLGRVMSIYRTVQKDSEVWMRCEWGVNGKLWTIRCAYDTDNRIRMHHWTLNYELLHSTLHLLEFRTWFQKSHMVNSSVWRVVGTFGVS